VATSNFPSSLDTTSTLPASISETANLNSPNHADMHEVTNDAIIEIEEKLGTGDTTASTGAVLIGTGSGASAWDTSPTFLGAVTVGVDGTGHDVKFFGDSASHYMLWYQSADELVLTSDSKLSFHDQGGGENIVASADGHLEVNAGTTLDLTAPTIDLNASTEVNIDGDVDLNGAINISGGTASSNNLQVTFAEGYTIHADNDGTGSDSSRLWFSSPDNGEMVLGPRASEDLLHNLRLRSTTIAAEGILNVTGLLTANGGLTIQDGDTFTFDTEALTDCIDSGETWASNDTSIATTGAINARFAAVHIASSAPNAGAAGEIWIDTSS
jgi:hypothetical protein